MSVAMFDSLKFANKLKAAGVPPEQAEAHASVASDLVIASQQDLATKTEIQLIRGEILQLRSETQQEFKQVRSEVQQFRTETQQEFKQVRSEVQQFRTEIQQEFKQVRSEAQQFRTEIQQEFKQVRSEAQQFRTEMNGELKLLRWMSGVSITLSISMVLMMLRIIFAKGF